MTARLTWHAYWTLGAASEAGRNAQERALTDGELGQRHLCIATVAAELVMHKARRQETPFSLEETSFSAGLWWSTLEAGILSFTGVRIPPGGCG